MGAFFRALFLKKGHFLSLHSPKQMPFLTTSNESINFKAQGTKLSVLVTPNKGLEKALEMQKYIYIVIHHDVVSSYEFCQKYHRLR